jgi:hypothetical protein
MWRLRGHSLSVPEHNLEAVPLSIARTCPLVVPSTQGTALMSQLQVNTVARAPDLSPEVGAGWSCRRWTWPCADRPGPCREHVTHSQQPRQPALTHTYDHARPGEWHQAVAPGEEP